MLQIFDQFLESYAQLKQFCVECEFKDEKNPVDGVVYPHICREVPGDVAKEVFDKLSQFKGQLISNPTLFLRMSPSGVHVPHQAHTDIVMGQYSLMLYLHEQASSGTAFLRHVMTGISYQPVLAGFTNIIQEDMNNPEAWAVYQRVLSKENRAVIFDAGCIHRAEPVGGFGDTQANARIVLTCFFS